MAHIDARAVEAKDGWQVSVEVQEGGSATRHEVGVKRADYERLTGGKATPAELVRRSFEFLLEREPKEAILPRFDLMVIGRYFPEFERELAGRL